MNDDQLRTTQHAAVRRLRTTHVVSAVVMTMAVGVLMVDTVLAQSSSVAQPTNDVGVRSPQEAFSIMGEPSFVLSETSPSTTTTLSSSVGESGATLDTSASMEATSGETSFGDLLSPEELTPTLRTIALVGVLSLVPAVLVMTTCFARFAIVFGLLRQGLGGQQWLPNQIVLALSLFLTLLVMAPVWSESYEVGIKPYADGEYATSAERTRAFELAVTRAAEPVRRFMGTQIAATGNEAAIDMLWSYQQASSGESEVSTSVPAYYEDVPFSVLLPAYLLSELKTAFVIGFQVVLPFLVIDLVTASVLTGMGLMMLPPVLVSLPFKLLLFVLIDGWALTVEMVLTSVPTG